VSAGGEGEKLLKRKDRRIRKNCQFTSTNAVSHKSFSSYRLRLASGGGGLGLRGGFCGKNIIGPKRRRKTG